MRTISNEELVVVAGGITSSVSALQDQEAREAYENLLNMVDAFNNEKNRFYQPEATIDW